MIVAYPVDLDGVDPLVSVFRVLRSQVPHTVVNTDVQPALVELVRLKNTQTKKREGMSV